MQSCQGEWTLETHYSAAHTRTPSGYSRVLRFYTTLPALNFKIWQSLVPPCQHPRETWCALLSDKGSIPLGQEWSHPGTWQVLLTSWSLIFNTRSLLSSVQSSGGSVRAAELIVIASSTPCSLAADKATWPKNRSFRTSALYGVCPEGKWLERPQSQFILGLWWHPCNTCLEILVLFVPLNITAQPRELIISIYTSIFTKTFV